MRVLVCLLSGVASLWCQSQTATLTGSVLDGSGAVVPDVSLRLTNTETGEAFVSRSNENGAYVRAARQARSEIPARGRKGWIQDVSTA